MLPYVFFESIKDLLCAFQTSLVFLTSLGKNPKEHSGKAFAGAVPWDPWMQSRTTTKDLVENIIKCDLMYR